MWISVLTPVTISIIVTERVSTLIAHGTESPPMATQSATTMRAPSVCCCSARPCSTATPKASATAALATTPVKRSPSRRPSARLISRPATGKAMIKGATANQPLTAASLQCMLCLHPARSALQAAHLVDIDAVLGLEDGEDQRQPDGHLGCRHGDDEEDDDVAAHLLQRSSVSDERQVGGVEHQLHRHEGDDGVAPDQHTDRAQREQDRRESHDVGGRNIHRFSFGSSRVSTIAPTMAASSSPEIASKGIR